MPSPSPENSLSSEWPLVSVVIPVYNREKLVAEAIRSAQAQTYPNIEIIVSDNRSTDRTYEVCQALASVDARIHLHRNAENLGPVRNWLAGIGKAEGRYLKLLFSDDLLAPQSIETMVSAMQAESAAVALSTVLIGAEPWQGDRMYTLAEQNTTIGSRAYRHRYLRGRNTPVSPCAFLFDRLVYQTELTRLAAECPPEFLRTGAGIDVLSVNRSIATAGVLLFLSEPLTYFRSHGDSITISQKPAIAEAYTNAKAMEFRAHYGLLAAIGYRLLRLARRLRGR